MWQLCRLYRELLPGRRGSMGEVTGWGREACVCGDLLKLARLHSFSVYKMLEAECGEKMLFVPFPKGRTVHHTLHLLPLPHANALVFPPHCEKGFCCVLFLRYSAGFTDSGAHSCLLWGRVCDQSSEKTLLTADSLITLANGLWLSGVVMCNRVIIEYS